MTTTILNTIKANLSSSNSKYNNSIYSDWNKTSIQNKGKVGEAVAETILVNNGHLVGARMNTTHDRMVDGKKVEIKTLFQAEQLDTYKFYGFNPTDDAHYWLLVFVTPKDDVVLVKMDREAIAKMYTWESKKSQVIEGTLEDFVKAGELLYTV